MTTRRTANSVGFTLVEVLLVIVVLGIVIGIGAMIVGNMVDDRPRQAKTSSIEETKACRIEQSLYAVAVQVYKEQKKQLPKSDADIEPFLKQESKYWTVTDSGKSADRVKAKAGVTLPTDCVDDPKT